MLTADRSRADSGDRQTTFEAVATGYVGDLKALIDTLDLEALGRLTARLRNVRDRGGTVFTAGNGGSAATATHWVNDLCKAASASGRARFRAIALSDSTSWLTALANDEGYDRVFAGQLENLGTSGDLLMVISASGRSPNLLAAVAAASAHGMETAALLGFDGGLLRDEVDEAVVIATEPGAYGLVETMHSIAADIVTTFLIEDRPDSSGS